MLMNVVEESAALDDDDDDDDVDALRADWLACSSS